MPGLKKETQTIGKKTQRFERKYLQEFVYGGMDGVITTFAVVSGVMGASLSSLVVLVLGFANIFSDGFSISVAHYFSIKSKNELVRNPDKHPMKGAVVAFFSFLFMGLIPLLSFLVGALTQNESILGNQFEYSAALTALALVMIGWFRGEVIGRHKVKSCVETFLIGGVAALLAFGVGRIISALVF